jgi:NitT/TauT family transport system substrate-binding protein
MRDWKTSLGLVAAAALLIVACGGGGGGPTTRPSGAAPSSAGTPGTSVGPMTEVELQLQWEPQAQFAGYFAADREGYYAEEGLHVTMLRGGAEVIPQVVGSAPDGPEFTIAWVPKVLEVRAKGQSDLVDIAQIFQRSGTRSVSWAAGKGPQPTSDTNITSPENFAGKKVGVWDFGNEYEVTAGGLKFNLVQNQDYTKVIQPFNMDLLLNREIDVAEAMIYNEYAQVLEATNAETGELYQPEDLNVINYNEVGTAMLQDALWARQAWLAEAGNEDIAVRFLRASFRGWMFCVDNQDKCIQYTVDAGSTLPGGHQRWMMNEILPLVWPSPDGIGTMPADFWNSTVEISKTAGIIPGDPDQGSYRTDLAEQARADIEGDVNQNDFQKGTVEVTPGGVEPSP